MIHEASPPASSNSSVLPVVAGLFAIGVFAIDTLSPLGMAVAVLYVVVVLLAVNFLPRRGVLLVAMGCAALAMLSYVLQHGETGGAPLVRLLVSLAAIGITAFLVLKNQSAATVLYEQARLLDLTHDTIFVRDMNDVITYWNRGAEALYGWGRDQAIGKVTHQLLQTSFPAPFEEITAELLRSDRWEGEIGHAKQDGQRLVVASRWALQRDGRGRPVAILETNTDVTDRKRAEERLREAERELRATIDTIPAMVMRVAVDGTVEFVNARWSEEGFSEEGLLADWTSYVHPDDLAEFVKVRTRSLATGEPYEAEVRFRRIDGEYRWCLIRVVSLRDETGKPVKRYSTATNIEDRKRAENALRRSEALLAETQGLSRTGSLLLDASTREVIWSAECARIFGYDPSVKPTISLALQRVHPDDVGLAQWAIDSALEGGIDTAYSEYRLVMPDGSVKYVHSAIRSDADASGGRLALGAVTDVTAAKLAEVALHEAQTELTHVTRMTTLGELTASIAHEVNQPLAAIVTNGEVCLRLLDQEAGGPCRGARGDRRHDQQRQAGQRDHPPGSRALQENRDAEGRAGRQRRHQRGHPAVAARGAQPSGVASPGPRAGAAGRARRSHPAAAGDHQSGRQRHGGDGAPSPTDRAS